MPPLVDGLQNDGSDCESSNGADSGGDDGAVVDDFDRKWYADRVVELEGQVRDLRSQLDVQSLEAQGRIEHVDRLRGELRAARALTRELQVKTHDLSDSVSTLTHKLERETHRGDMYEKELSEFRGGYTRASSIGRARSSKALDPSIASVVTAETARLRAALLAAKRSRRTAHERSMRASELQQMQLHDAVSEPFEAATASLQPKPAITTAALKAGGGLAKRGSFVRQQAPTLLRESLKLDFNTHNAAARMLHSEVQGIVERLGAHVTAGEAAASASAAASAAAAENASRVSGELTQNMSPDASRDVGVGSDDADALRSPQTSEIAHSPFTRPPRSTSGASNRPAMSPSAPSYLARTSGVVGAYGAPSSRSASPAPPPPAAPSFDYASGAQSAVAAGRARLAVSMQDSFTASVDGVKALKNSFDTAIGEVWTSVVGSSGIADPIVNHVHTRLAAALNDAKTAYANALRGCAGTVTAVMAAEPQVYGAWHAALVPRVDCSLQADPPQPPDPALVAKEAEVRAYALRLSAANRQAAQRESGLQLARDRAEATVLNLQDVTFTLHRAVRGTLHAFWKHRVRWAERLPDPLRTPAGKPLRTVVLMDISGADSACAGGKPTVGKAAADDGSAAAAAAEASGSPAADGHSPTAGGARGRRASLAPGGVSAMPRSASQASEGKGGVGVVAAAAAEAIGSATPLADGGQGSRDGSGDGSGSALAKRPPAGRGSVTAASPCVPVASPLTATRSGLASEDEGAGEDKAAADGEAEDGEEAVCVECADLAGTRPVKGFASTRRLRRTVSSALTKIALADVEQLQGFRQWFMSGAFGMGEGFSAGLRSRTQSFTRAQVAAGAQPMDRNASASAEAVAGAGRPLQGAAARRGSIIRGVAPHQVSVDVTGAQPTAGRERRLSILGDVQRPPIRATGALAAGGGGSMSPDGAAGRIGGPVGSAGASSPSTRARRSSVVGSPGGAVKAVGLGQLPILPQDAVAR